MDILAAIYVLPRPRLGLFTSQSARLITRDDEINALARFHPKHFDTPYACLTSCLT